MAERCYTCGEPAADRAELDENGDCPRCSDGPREERLEKEYWDFMRR